MCLKWWLASKRWDELVFARFPCYKEVLLIFYSCASFLASGKHQKSGSSHSWITQKHCVRLNITVLGTIILHSKTTNWKTLKKPRYFSICSVLPKDRHFLFRRSHQIRGHYRKIRKKGQGYAICIARNWREYQRVLVYKTIGEKTF